MLKAARQKEIVALLQGGGVVEVSVLAERFQTSPITVRRDLIELQERGVLARTRGGAIPGNEVYAEGWARYESVSYAERERENYREKRAIAELAAQSVSDGDCILVNGGTTCRHLAEALRGHHHLHVVTNGLTVAMELAKSRNATVHLLPGTVDFQKMTSVGRLETGAFENITVRAAFLGVHGISASGGIGMLTPEEAVMNRAFVDAAQSVNVLVDSSKFKAQAIFRITHLDKVARVFTDDGITDEVRHSLEKAGVEVLVAHAEENGHQDANRHPLTGQRFPFASVQTCARSGPRMNANAHLRPAMNALLSPPPTPATGGSASAQAMNEPLQKQRGVRFSAGAHDDDACAAVLLSIAECRTLRPVSVEVLPFLCSFAHRLRHTFDGCVDVAVDVDRACSAWTVDRDALEEALLEVVLGSVCAIRRRGRLTLRASVDDRSNQRSTVLTVFNKVPHEDCSTFSWRN